MDNLTVIHTCGYPPVIHWWFTCGYLGVKFSRWMPWITGIISTGSINKRFLNPEFHSATSYKMAVKLCIPTEVEIHLETLKVIFLGLPDTAPNGSQFYSFMHFIPDWEKVKDFGGKDCAVNHALEIVFCPQGHQDEPIILKEEAQALCLLLISWITGCNHIQPQWCYRNRCLIW